MSKVTIVGGGFSGLATGHYLVRRGYDVEIVERANRLGGLIGTLKTPQGIAEAAAHAIVSSRRVEDLSTDLALPLVYAGAQAKARYVFRGRPRRWPLGLGETLGVAGRLAFRALSPWNGIRPHANETIESWGRRLLGPNAVRYGLAPVLQGVYAGDVREMSAALVFPRKGRKRAGARPRRPGLVAPREGMGELIQALERDLAGRGARFLEGTAFGPRDVTTPSVICTSAKEAAALLKRAAPEAAAALGALDMVPLLTLTAFYPPEENTLAGFGVLFPREEGFRALGVLFNTNIFEGRGPAHSETWIFGGATDRGFVDLEDCAIYALLEEDRRRLFGRRGDPLSAHVFRWPAALPHYNLALRSLLESDLALPRGLYLVGNYLGGIGLARILDRAAEVAERVSRERAA